MYGLTLILTLAVIGGAIAYIGDRIGMKVGRKRLSLFGLRPYYTSIIITIFTGIFIAGSSIMVLSIASNDVRTALFRMRAVQESLTSLQQEFEFASIELAELQRDRDRAMLEVETLQDERDRAMLEIETLQEDRDRAMDEMETLQEDRDRARLEVEDLQERRVDLEHDIAFLLSEYEILADEYGFLYEQYRRFEDTMRLGEFVFWAGEIVLAEVIEAGQPFEQIRSKVDDFVAQAEAVVRRRHNESTLGIPEQVIAFSSQALHEQQGEFVLRAVSKNNTLGGEQVATYLELWPRQLLFGEGTVIAEIRVNTDIESNIDRTIFELLDIVKEIVIRRGMLTEPDGTAINLSGETFLNALVEADRLQGEIVIQAVAGSDTWSTVGPVEVELRVEKTGP